MEATTVVVMAAARAARVAQGATKEKAVGRGVRAVRVMEADIMAEVVVREVREVLVMGAGKAVGAAKWAVVAVGGVA